MMLSSVGSKRVVRVILSFYFALGLSAGTLPRTTLRGACFSSVQVSNPASNEGELSVLKIPVTFSLAELFQRCETILPKEIDESSAYIDAGKDALGNLGIKYRVWRDPLRLSMEKNQLNLDARVYYWIEAAQIIHKPKPLKGDIVQKLGSCGEDEPPRQADIGLTTEISIGADWSLVPKTRVRQVKLLDKCSMTFLNLDQTNKIKKRLSEKLEQVSALIDRRIGRLDLRSRVEEAWEHLQKPVFIQPGDRYLCITPVDISLSDLNGQGDKLETSATIKAFVVFVWGHAPAEPIPQMKPLPPAKHSDATDTQSHIALEAFIPFEAAAAQLSESLVNHKYSVAGNEVAITAAELRKSNAGIEMALQIAGSLKGKIYVRGKLAFDQSTNTLLIEDPDFAVESTDPVTKSFANAVAGSPSFKAKLAAQVRWPVGERIDVAKKQLTAALNHSQGDFRLIGDISRIGVAGVRIATAGESFPGSAYGAITSDSLVITLRIEASLKIESDK